MTRPSTDLRDAKIIRMFRNGMRPKEIAWKMKLPNVWAVYDAMKRWRRSGQDRRQVPRGIDRRKGLVILP